MSELGLLIPEQTRFIWKHPLTPPGVGGTQIFASRAPTRDGRHILFYWSCPNFASFYPNRPDFLRKRPLTPPGWAWPKKIGPMSVPGPMPTFIPNLVKIGPHLPWFHSTHTDGHTTSHILYRYIYIYIYIYLSRVCEWGWIRFTAQKLITKANRLFLGIPLQVLPAICNVLRCNHTSNFLCNFLCNYCMQFVKFSGKLRNFSELPAIIANCFKNC